MEDSYACPICGTWVKKDSGHNHPQWIAGCEHDYVPYPIDYVSSSSLIKMMCRKCLKVEYLNG